MSILQIAVLAGLAIIVGRLSRGRQLGMLAISALAIFWLQPAEPFVSLEYWLPVATLGIAVLSWALTSTPEVRGWRQNWAAAAVLVTVAVVADLRRYSGIPNFFGSSTPAVPLVLAMLAVTALETIVLVRWQRAQATWQTVALIGIVLAFVLLKSPSLSDAAIAFLARRGTAANGNGVTALSWLGFSYVAFRLMHTIRDRQAGRMPAVTLGEYVNYVIFFPSFTAGPIDRIERFLKDLCNPLPLTDQDWVSAGSRLLAGLFKKFVIADLLSVISINDVLVARVQSPAWMWVFLYAYAFRIFLDFSGYTDVAIGMGRLMGIRLPENFAAPYLKPNLSQFWNSWHMTLTQWFRAYFFNPLARALRSAEHPMPAWLAMLLAQLSTMVLIGLWHGMTMGFVLWGLWHGIGLFIHSRWSEFVRPRVPRWTQTPRGQFLMNAGGTLLTFHYVTLGWVFFGLSGPRTALLAMQRLFGLA